MNNYMRHLIIFAAKTFFNSKFGKLLASYTQIDKFLYIEGPFERL